MKTNLQGQKQTGAARDQKQARIHARRLNGYYTHKLSDIMRGEVIAIAWTLRIRDVHEDIMPLVNIVLGKVDADGEYEVLLVCPAFVQRSDLRTLPVGWKDMALLVYGVGEEPLRVLGGS